MASASSVLKNYKPKRGIMPKATAFRYMRNVGRSLGYSLIKNFDDMNPTVSALFRQSKELKDDLYQAISDFRSGAVGFDGKEIKNTIAGAAKDAFKNLMTDLRTGEWYNKARIEKVQNQVIGSAMGIDFDDFGDFDMDFDKDLSDLDEHASIQQDATKAQVEAMDIVGGKISSAVSTATVKSADYIVQSAKANTKALYDLTHKGFTSMATGLAAVNSNISTLVKLGEPLTQHMQNSAMFFTKSSEYQDKALKLLEQIVNNTTPAAAKNKSGSRKTTLSDMITADGLIDIKGLIEYGKKNIKDSTSFLGGMLDMMGGVKGALKMGTASPLALILPLLTGQMFNVKGKRGITAKDAMKNFNEALSGFFGGALAKAKYSKINTGSYFVDGILDKLRDIFIPDVGFKSKTDPSKYEKGKVDWDGKSRKALMEVIPTQLGKILAVLSGEEEQIYDYDKGKWIKKGKVLSDKIKTDQYYANMAGGDFFSSLRSSVNNSGMRKSSKDEYNRQMDAFLRQVVLSDNDDFMHFMESDFWEKNKNKYKKSISKKVFDDMQLRAKMLRRYKPVQASKIPGSVLSNRAAYTRYLEDANDMRHRMDDGSMDFGNAGKSILTGLTEDNRKMLFYLEGIYQYSNYIAKNMSKLVPGAKVNRNGKIKFDPLPKMGDLKDRVKNNRTHEIDDLYVELDGNARNIDIRGSNVEESVGKVTDSFDDMPADLKEYQDKLRAGLIEEDEAYEKKIKNWKAGHERGERWKSAVHEKYDKIRNGKFKSTFDSIGNFFGTTSDSISKLLDEVTGGINDFIYGEDKNGKRRIDSIGDAAKEGLYNIANAFSAGMLKAMPDWMKKIGKSILDKINENEFVKDLKAKTKQAFSGMAKWFFSFNGGVSPNKQRKDEEHINNSMNFNGPGFNSGDGENYGDDAAEGSGLVRNLRRYASAGLSGNATQSNTNQSNDQVEKSGAAQVVHEAAIKIANKFKSGLVKLFGKNKPEDEKKKIEGNIEQMMKDAGLAKGNIAAGTLLGGGISLVTGAFIGPIAGAAIGAAAGFVSKSKKAQDLLFGEDDTEDKDGNIIPGKKGLLPKKVGEFFKKNVPSMAKGTGIGALGGLFLGSPVLGAIVGSSVGFAASSEKAKTWLFGKLVDEVDENGNPTGNKVRSGGKISKKFQDAVKKAFPHIPIGALAGLLAGPKLGLGPIPSILLGSTIGLATSTDKFKDWLFGPADKDGKRPKFGKGGFAQKLKEDLFQPIVGIFDKLGHRITETIKESVTGVGKKIREFIFKKLGGKIKDKLKQSRLGRALSRTGSKIAKGAWNLITRPGKFINDRLQRSSLNKGYAFGNLTSAERQELRAQNPNIFPKGKLASAMDAVSASIGNSEEDLNTLNSLLTNAIDPNKAREKAVLENRSEYRDIINGFAKQEEFLYKDRNNKEKIKKNKNNIAYNKCLNYVWDAIQNGDIGDPEKVKAKDFINQLEDDCIRRYGRSELFNGFDNKDKEKLVEIAEAQQEKYYADYGATSDEELINFINSTDASKEAKEQIIDALQHTSPKNRDKYLQRWLTQNGVDKNRFNKDKMSEKDKKNEEAGHEVNIAIVDVIPSKLDEILNAILGRKKDLKTKNMDESRKDDPIWQRAQKLAEEYNIGSAEDFYDMAKDQIESEKSNNETDTAAEGSRIRRLLRRYSAGASEQDEYMEAATDSTPGEDDTVLGQNGDIQENFGSSKVQKERKDKKSFLDSMKSIPLVGKGIEKLTGVAEKIKDVLTKPEKKESIFSKLFGGIKDFFSNLFGGSGGILSKLLRFLGTGFIKALPLAMGVGTFTGLFDGIAHRLGIGGNVDVPEDVTVTEDGVVKARKYGNVENVGPFSGEYADSQGQRMFYDSNIGEWTYEDGTTATGPRNSVWSYQDAPYSQKAVIQFGNDWLRRTLRETAKKGSFAPLAGLKAAGKDTWEFLKTPFKIFHPFKNGKQFFINRGTDFKETFGPIVNAIKNKFGTKAAEEFVEEVVSESATTNTTKEAIDNVFEKLGYSTQDISSQFANEYDNVAGAMDDFDYERMFANQADDIYEGISKNGDNVVDSILKNSDNVASSTAKNVTSNAAEAMAKNADDALEAAKGMDNIVDTFKKFFKKFASKFCKNISKESAEAVVEAGVNGAKNVARKAMEQAGKQSVKQGLKTAAKIVPVITVLLMIGDFIEGYQDASTQLHVLDPTPGEKIVSGLFWAIAGLVPFLQVIPISLYVDCFYNFFNLLSTLGIIDPNFIANYKARREEADAAVEASNEEAKAINEKYGTHLNENMDWTEYNKQIRGKYTWKEHIENEFNNGLNATKDFITGKSGKDYHSNLVKGSEKIMQYINKHNETYGTNRTLMDYENNFNQFRVTIDNMIRADEAERIVAVYNHQHNTSYTVDQYLNDKSIQEIIDKKSFYENLSIGQGKFQNDWHKGIGKTGFNASQGFTNAQADEYTKLALQKANEEWKTNYTLDDYYKSDYVQGLVDKYRGEFEAQYKVSQYLLKYPESNYTVKQYLEDAEVKKAVDQGIAPSFFDKQFIEIVGLYTSRLSDENKQAIINGAKKKYGIDFTSADEALLYQKQYEKTHPEESQTSKADSKPAPMPGSSGSGLFSAGSSSHMTLKEAMKNISSLSLGDQASMTMINLLTNMNSLLAGVYKSSAENTALNEAAISASTGTPIASSTSPAVTGTVDTESVKNDAANKVKNVVSKLKAMPFIGGVASLVSGMFSGGSSGFESQLDSKYSGISVGGKSMAENGCGPTTASMALKSLGIDSDVKSAASVANHYQTTGGTDISYFKDMFNSKGVGANYVSGASVGSAVASGRPVVLMGRDSSNRSKANSPFGPHNHYVVANGVDRSGNINISDPEGHGVRKYSPRILKNVSMGVAATGSALSRRRSRMFGIGGGTPSGATVEKGKKDLRELYDNTKDSRYIPTFSEVQNQTYRDAAKELWVMGLDGAAKYMNDIWTSHRDDRNYWFKYVKGFNTAFDYNFSNIDEFHGYNFEQDMSKTKQFQDSTYAREQQTKAQDANTQAYLNRVKTTVKTNATNDQRAEQKRERDYERASDLASKYIDQSGGHLSWDQAFAAAQNNLNLNLNVKSVSNQPISTLSSATQDPEKYIWDFLRQSGFGEIAVAGIMGNLEAESGCNPESVEGDYIKGYPGYNVVFGNEPYSCDEYCKNFLFPAYARKGMSINHSTYKIDGYYYPGIGIAGFTGTFMDELVHFAKKKNLSYNNMGVQLEFLVETIRDHGSKGCERSYFLNYNRLPELIEEATTPEYAADVFFDLYERNNLQIGYHQKNADGSVPRREGFAREFYDQYKGSSITTNIKDYKSSTFTNIKNGSPAASKQAKGGILSQIISAFTTNIGSLFGEDAPDTIGGTTYSGSSGGPGNSAQQALVNTMKSVEGKLKYSQDYRNPDNGSGDCSSTVNWAYNKVLGEGIGDYTGAQITGSNTHFVDEDEGAESGNLTGRGPDLSKLMPGDLMFYYDSDSTYPYKVGHVEMYAGDGQRIGHGGGMGPVMSDATASSDKYIGSRRFNGIEQFSATGSGLVYSPSKAGLTLLRSNSSMFSGGASEIPTPVQRSNPSIIAPNGKLNVTIPKFNNTSIKKTSRGIQVNIPNSNGKAITKDTAALLSVLIGFAQQVTENTAKIEDIYELLQKGYDNQSEVNTSIAASGSKPKSSFVPRPSSGDKSLGALSALKDMCDQILAG